MNQTEQPALGSHHSGTMLGRWWSGKERLVIVYWGSMAILVALYLAAFVTRDLALPSSVDTAVNIVGFGVYLFLAVAIWSCAFNVKHRVWGYLVRIQVGVGVVNSIGTILRSVS